MPKNKHRRCKKRQGRLLYIEWLSSPIRRKMLKRISNSRTCRRDLTRLGANLNQLSTPNNGQLMDKEPFINMREGNPSYLPNLPSHQRKIKTQMTRMMETTRVVMIMMEMNQMVQIQVIPLDYANLKEGNQTEANQYSLLLR